jgi:hypothetical protein
MTDPLPPVDGTDNDEPRWDPGDEDATPEPEIDPGTPPLEFDDDGDPEEPGGDPSAEEVYAERQQVLSPGLNGSPFATDEETGNPAGSLG